MKTTKKITYNELFNRSVILNALPLAGLHGKSLCDLIVLQVDYTKAVEAFNSRMEEALKKLKAEKYPDFDSESQKKEEDRSEDYKTWLDELNKLLTDMRTEEGKKEMDGNAPVVTREVLTALCETGVEGEVRFPGGTDASPNMVPKAQVLRMVAAMIDD